MQLKKEWRNLILMMAFFLLLRFFPMIFLGKTMMWGDNYSLMVPGKVYLADNIKQGILPLWNPEIFAGLPLINDINQSVLYFTNLFFVLLPTAVALNLTIISHIVLLMLGTYLLVKKVSQKVKPALLAMLLMGLSTQASGLSNNISTIQALAWFPWLAWCGLKLHEKNQHIFLYAFLVLMQFLAGYPQYVIYAIAFSVLLSGFYQWEKINWWPWLKRWMITAVIVLMLSAVAWLPFLEMLLDSTRMSQSVAQSQVGSLKISAIMKMFLPYFFDRQDMGVKWGPSWSDQPNVFFYVGNFILFLLATVLLDKKQRRTEDCFYFIFIILTILLALGSNLPGFHLLQQILPFLKFGRGPSMILILTNLAIVIWGVLVFQRVKIKKFYRQVFGVTWLSILLFALIWQYFIYFDFSSLWNTVDKISNFYLTSSVFHTLERDLIISKMIATNLITAAVFSLLALWTFVKNKKILTIFIIALDVLLHTQAMFYFAPQEIYSEVQNTLVEQINNDFQYRSLTRNANSPYTDYGAYWEAMTVRRPFSDSFIDQQELQNYQQLQRLRNGVTPNWNLSVNIATIHGYTTLLPKDFSLLWSKTGQTDINFINYIETDNPLLQDWAVKYYLVDKAFEIKEAIPFAELAREGGFVLYELPEAKARFRFANDEAINLINFQENPNHISFDFNNLDQKYLIVADRYDRNWQAWINGEKVAIENFNGMRKLTISIGENSLVMQFIPKTFYWGLGISLLTILGAGIYLMVAKKAH